MSNLSTNGLCIIPEGRYLKSCKSEGYPYEVSSIALLHEILDSAKLNRLTVFYLTASNGISYADDIVKAITPFYKYPKDRWTKWSAIVSEEIARKCMQYQTSRVYFMSRSVYDSLDIVYRLLASRGIEAIRPIAGTSMDKAKSILGGLLVDV